jgi:DNA primase catalytic core
MGLHKLTAGDGYTYLTRQVAVHDATDRGHAGLGDYYSEKGESPGQWWGAGLDALDLQPGGEVTEQQMRNLFGEGRHPDADRIEDAALDVGATAIQAERASRLGRLFAVHRGAPEFAREVAKRFTEHNYHQGLHWKTPVPAEVRARIRTELAEEMFTAEHGRPPADDRERAGFLARASRQKTTAVAGFDLAFTPVKSVSTLWALADPEVAAQVEQAHHAAVEKTLAVLEREVLFTRRGRGGVQQVKARGMVATMFTHRDSRAGDPNLHTHVAVSNKVQDADGRWLAVDGRVLYKAKVTLSETYNTLVEAELSGRLGVRFAPRGDATDGKRDIREVVGIDPRLQQAWSSRSAVIEGRRRELAVTFQATHGRPPTPIESLALAQQATLETRQAKHSPRSEAEQRATWRTEAVRVLGSVDAIKGMVTGALSQTDTRQRVTESWVDGTAAAVVERVQADRATWQVWHLRAEAQRRIRAAGISLSDNAEAVDRVVEYAIEHYCIAFADPDPLTESGAEPAALRRPDGASVYSVHGSRLFTARTVVDAERRLLAAAQKAGGRQVSEVRVGIALAEATANGTVLNAAQAAMVRELATSGARLQLALAPAGTGKTTALEVLARAWRDTGGTIIGLAPSAVAAQQLGEAIGHTTDTLAKLVWSLDPTHAPPGWVAGIDQKTLVVIDEAGMAGTVELAQAVDFVLARGGSVRLVGDDRQLAAVGAGGILRDIATTVGAVTLTEVRRFTDPAEAAATLAVREGDTSALGFYADRGRIHVGDLASAADQAYRRWAADTAKGQRSILLAPTRELVAELNTRARNDRLTADPQAAEGPAVRLADGTRASAGDVIVTRRNDRTLRISATDWVKNGDRWTVQTVHPDGSLTAIHEQLRRGVRLPRNYVTDGRVQLGYASTIHGAQGITVDTSHTVLTGEEDRSLLYVATSRGRTSNDIYLAVGSDGDPHTVIHPDTLLPPTALDQLAAILGRDTSQVSATTAARDAINPATMLRDAAARYHDAVTFAAEQVLGDEAMRRLDRAADLLHDGLTEAPAWPTLRSHLALRALDGQDPILLLNTAIGSAPLTDAADVAAVIDARLPGPEQQGPLPWLPAIPTQLVEDFDWGGYLIARHDRLTELIGQVEEGSRAWSPDTAPAWAHPLLDPANAGLRARLAVWRAVHGIPDVDTRPTGPHQIGTPGEHQRSLNRAIRAARPTGPFTHRAWYPALPEPVRADPWITPLCQRLGHIEAAGLNVTTYLHQALATDRPLPDEHAAAALWWRLVGHLGPAATRGDTHTAANLQASWLPDLVALVGTDRAETLQRSPAWPALVAAVDAASRSEWIAGQLLTTAVHGLPQDIRLEELCDALVLRVAVVTDPPEDPEALAPPHEDDLPPHDLHETEAPSWITNTPTLGSDAGSRRSIRAEQPGPTAVTRERIVELHRATLDYYRDCYPRSWAPDYLRQRLHTDLTDHPHLTVGYAPPGPTSLIRHLTEQGATVEELDAAGLVRRRERGDLVDAFRDRLMLPILDNDGAPIGFVGRRNPTKTDDDYAGPKYLNTRTTAVFTKGEALYGLAETRTALAQGATPVLAEGPLDALAITVASGSTAVGLAPLGTALTSGQVDLLRSYFHDDPTRIAIATDADAAGWKAAQTAYWDLTAAGADPTHLALPDGLDPAQLLQEHGSKALQDAISNRRPLAADMINHHLSAADDWTNPATRLRLVRLAGQIIAVRPPQTWAASIDQITQRLHLSPGVLHLEVIDQSQQHADDPVRYTEARMEEIQARARARRLNWDSSPPMASLRSRQPTSPASVQPPAWHQRLGPHISR